jgi:hypothetical protein
VSYSPIEAALLRENEQMRENEKMRGHQIAEWVIKEHALQSELSALKQRAERAEKGCYDARLALEMIVNSCVNPEQAHRAVMVDLKPIREMIQKLDAILKGMQ